eukprot:13701969-Alexandrium_andersonii.AAC.1
MWMVSCCVDGWRPLAVSTLCVMLSSAALHQHMSVLPRACGAEHRSCASHGRCRVCALRARVGASTDRWAIRVVDAD